MDETNAIPYTDLIFEKKYSVPKTEPYYLLLVLTMILRNNNPDDPDDPHDKEVKDIIQKDPLLQKVLFDDTQGTYNKKLILVLVRITQQAYGINYVNVGTSLKNTYITEEEYKDDLFFQSISLLWNYSPCVSSKDTIAIVNKEST